MKITTYPTGAAVDPLNPQHEDPDYRDIAWALSNQCRYNGHCRYFYSVAQHTLVVSDLVEKHYGSHGVVDDPEMPSTTTMALWALLHDTSETYLGDCVRPMKVEDPYYRAAERRWDEVVRRRWALPAQSHPHFDELKWYIKANDRLALIAEMRVLKKCRGRGYLPLEDDNRGEADLPVIIPAQREWVRDQWEQRLERLVNAQ